MFVIIISLLVYSLLGCLFPIPRILYAMSCDGLLFEFLSMVNEKTKTPVIATMICGVGAGKLYFQRVQRLSRNESINYFNF